MSAAVEAPRFTEAYARAHPGLPLSVGVVREIDLRRSKEAVAAARPAFEVLIPQGEVASLRTADTYGRFFAARGDSFPVANQFARWKESGLPSLPPLVELLLLCELSTGTLLGIQDLDAVRSPIVYDLAGESEEFLGLRATIRCRKGEIVLRDDAGIIASYFQGPDSRTRLTRGSRNLLLLGFHAPGAHPGAVDRGLRLLVDVLRPASAMAEFDTFVP